MSQQRRSRPVDRGILGQAWGLLDKRERRQGVAVLILLVVGALSNALMVVSVLPFLTVLGNPGMIDEIALFAWAQTRFGLTDDYDFIVALGLATALAIVLTNGIQLLKTYVLTRFTMMRIHSVAIRLLSAYLKQPYEFFLNSHSGEMTKGVLSEADQVVRGFLRPLGELIAAALSAVAIMAALIWVEPRVALVGMATLGVIYAVIYASTQSRLRSLGRLGVVANGERFRIASEALGGIKDVKVLGCEQGYVDRFRSPSLEYARTQVVANVIAQLPKYLIQTFLFGGIVVLCLVMIDRASFADGAALAVLAPVLGTFALGGQKLMPEVQKMFASLAELRFGAAAVESVHGGISAAHGRPALSGKSPVVLGLKHSLVFDGVGYVYPHASRAGLSGATFDIRHGERIGIVGSTGSGKSTLADLVLGLLRPQHGTIRIDGTPLTEANLRAWQASVGYVPQEIFLIDRSVAENIAFGELPHRIDRARLEAAARLAQIDGFIRAELPQGYETLVGERGVRLSGGQRQRIGIARALYHDADLIVFDEATSALDNLTEREVMAAIEALPGNKTVLMIAHRLSTVRRCDRILVLEKGEVVGFGAWDRLRQECPAFRRLVEVAHAA